MLKKTDNGIKSSSRRFGKTTLWALGFGVCVLASAMFVLGTPLANAATGSSSSLKKKKKKKYKYSKPVANSEPKTCEISIPLALNWIKKSKAMKKMYFHYDSLYKLEDWQRLTEKQFKNKDGSSTEAHAKFQKIGADLMDLAKTYASQDVADCGTCKALNDWGFLFYLVDEKLDFQKAKFLTPTDIDGLDEDESDKPSKKLKKIKLKELTRGVLENEEVQTAINDLKKYYENEKIAPKEDSDEGKVVIQKAGGDSDDEQRIKDHCFDKDGETGECLNTGFRDLYAQGINILIAQIKSVGKKGNKKLKAIFDERYTCRPSNGKKSRFYFNKFINTSGE